jgi:hypothetical protein
LVFIGDSLMFYSYITFIILMANRQPFVLSSDGTTRSFHYDPPQEFAKYPPRTFFSNFSEACQEVGERPFVLFMNNNQYLDTNPIFLSWLSSHPDALLFINRGYHYEQTTPSYRTQLEGILSHYLSRIDPHSKTGHGGAIIWRSIHMAHPGCQHYQDSFPFTAQNYSLYESNKDTVTALRATHHWYDIIQQDRELIRPLIDQMIREDTHQAREKLFYLDILSSSKFQIRRHSMDCLHYCLNGPMDSWLVFLLNTISLIDSERSKHGGQRPKGEERGRRRRTN